MPIRNNPCHDVVNPGGQVSYADSPNRAQYLSQVIHRMVSEEKAQETLNTSDAPQVFPNAEKSLQRVLERLEKLYKDMSWETTSEHDVFWTLEDIIRQARGDIDESS